MDYLNAHPLLFRPWKEILTKDLEFLYTPPPKVNICYVFPYGFAKGRQFLERAPSRDPQ